jgi:hypothetical protein
LRPFADEDDEDDFRLRDDEDEDDDFLRAEPLLREDERARDELRCPFLRAEVLPREEPLRDELLLRRDEELREVERCFFVAMIGNASLL